MESENENKPVEIMPGMTTEQMTAVYFNADALKEPNYRLYQLNGDGHRYYYRYENNVPVFYPSVTTMLKQVMPTSPFLIKWMIENGAEGSAEKRDLAAAYGTFMHAQFETLLIQRCYDLDSVGGVLLDYMDRNNLPEKFYGDNIDRIRKDIFAFAQFVKDYNVRPLAIEIALVHPEHHYAGMLDLPCIMTDSKTGQDFRAIVDFKSGRKGFYEEHELQLFLYRDIWNYNYPDIEITRLFNFAPKDWRGVKPTYTLAEQTNKPSAAKIPALLELARIADGEMDNTFTVISGVLTLDDYKPAEHITALSLAELITSKSKIDETPDGGFVPEKAGSVPGTTQNVPGIAENVPEPAYNEPEPVKTSKRPSKPKKAVTEPKTAELTNLLNGDIEI